MPNKGLKFTWINITLPSQKQMSESDRSYFAALKMNTHSLTLIGCDFCVRAMASSTTSFQMNSQFGIAY